MEPKVNVKMKGNFYISDHVDGLFREYARAALKTRNSEIGGLVRVEKRGDDWVATDLQILPQTASGATFDFEEEAMAVATMKLAKAGRMDELHQWNCMIHSHPPNCEPFLSGRDDTNIKKFAGCSAGSVWSIIMTADENVGHCKYAVHYYTRLGDANVLFQNLPVLFEQASVHPERERIEAEVLELIKAAPPVVHGGFSGKGYGGRHGGHGVSPMAPGWGRLGADEDELDDEMHRMSLLGFEFDDLDDELIEVELGSIVRVNLTDHGLAEFSADEGVFDTAVEMDGQEYEVEECDDDRVKLQGLWFNTKEIEVVQV